MPTKWYQGEVERIENLSENTREFSLKVIDEQQFDFVPGQFITLDLPVSDKRLNRWRSYSLADMPDGNNIKLCISKMEGGLGTTYLFDEVRPGSVLKFKGPDGNFVLPEKIESDLVFVCNGTGVAPFRSMIKHIYRNNLIHSKIHLIFGGRTIDNILYREEFEQLASEQKEFDYDVAISREDVSDNGFYSGYVHQIYLEKYGQLDDQIFFLCGWTEMIDEAVANLLLKLGADKSQIKYELYG